jgi:uncharacterized protein YndB with AHSA1/START domain
MDHREVATTERELTLTRVLDAPRELVFRLWTDPKHLAQWWGPMGFTNPECEMDARPGGALRIVMRAPDGTDYPMIGTYHEVTPPERLVFSFSAVDGQGDRLIDGLTTVTFAERGGKTELIVQTRAVALVPPAIRMLEGMDAGWRQTLDRLDEEAGDEWRRATGQPVHRPVVITRTFDAPRERVFAAWTDPAQAARWMGPHGFTTISCEMDVRPGGQWRRSMRSPAGTEFCKSGVYREVVAPERLVITYADEDAAGNTGPETVVTVTFAEVGGKTELTLHHAFLATVALRQSHHQGWTGSLERLAGHLAQQSG